MDVEFLSKRSDIDLEENGIATFSLATEANLEGSISRRRARNSEGIREYICGCSKAYLSYPALYTHIRNKHDNVLPIGTKIPHRRQIDKPVMIKPAAKKFATGIRKPSISTETPTKGPWADFVMIKRRCRLIVETFQVITFLSQNRGHTVTDIILFLKSKEFQVYSDSQSLISCLEEIKKRGEFEIVQGRGPKACFSINEALNCNMILACFMVCTGKHAYRESRDYRDRNFFVETLHVIMMLRRLLNSSGYQPKLKQRFMNGSMKSTDRLPEYCSDKHNGIEVLKDLITEFFSDLFPCYQSEVVR